MTKKTLTIEFVYTEEPKEQESTPTIKVVFNANRMHYKDRAVEHAYKAIQKLLREMHMDPYYAEGDQLY